MRTSKLLELKTYIEELKTIKLYNEQKGVEGFLSMKSFDCDLNNGKTIRREQMLKNNSNGSAAIILPITKENNTLLVVQPRVFTRNTVGVELPAGYIEDNEEPVVSAKRELEEETGYVSDDFRLVAKYYQDQGCSSALNHSFIAFNCEKKSVQHLDKDEYIRYFECTYEEALELVDMGYIMDANSILTLEKSKILIKGGKRYV